MSEFAGKHILIIIENLSAPFDRRVWQEACTLKEKGARVSIICPKMKEQNKSYELIDDIEIYRHPLPIEGSGVLGYLLEYSTALFWQGWLSMRIFFKHRFHVIHGCNPPDLIFLTALPYKLLGVKYVFDHHDINPELYLAKFARKDFFYKIMLLFERLTFLTANFSIATNESYKEIAIRRGKMDPGKVSVVRSGPGLKRMKITNGNPVYRKGKKYLVGYLGVIGGQEGLDLLMQTVQTIKKTRSDIHFSIVGGGTDLEKIKQMALALQVNDCVDFYGRVNDELMVDILNTCDICVNPDPPTEMNNLSTMNKIMEYMALKKPIVQFDLKEGRFSAGGASLYVKHNDVEDFTSKVFYLLDNHELRKQMGVMGYQRVLSELSWDHESKNLVDFYKKVFLHRDM